MNEVERVRFGMYLKGLRALRSLTLRETAQRTDGKLSASYLSQIENGLKPPPSGEALAALARALESDAAEMFRRAGVKEPLPQEVYDPDDLRRAFMMVLSDPRYAFGTYVVQEDVSLETMAFVVEMYQKARGLKLIHRRNEDDDEPDMKGVEGT